MKYLLTEDQLKEILYEACGIGMDLRQKQLLGGLTHNKSGKELINEYIEQVTDTLDTDLSACD